MEDGEFIVLQEILLYLKPFTFHILPATGKKQEATNASLHSLCAGRSSLHHFDPDWKVCTMHEGSLLCPDFLCGCICVTKQ